VRLGATAPAAGAADPRLAEASRALESMLLRQVISSSKAFSGGSSAGSAVREGLFAETLADAVAGAGGLGLASELARSLDPTSRASAAAASAGPGRTLAGPAHAGAPGPTPLHPAPGQPLAMPVAGRVTSGFGLRADPFTGDPAEHDGLDLGAPEGTPIRVPLGGVVRSAGPRGGYGNAVEIDHGNGLVTLYGHAADLSVNAGDSVAAGQVIGTVGSTGRSTGPHLHFEVRQGGRAVHPDVLLKRYGLRAEGSIGSGP